jgi:hypothetical protein
MPDSDPLNPGYRWATVTPDDRSGILYIVAFLSFTYSGLTFITRCFIKWNVLGLDDAAICIAQASTPLALPRDTTELTTTDCQPCSVRSPYYVSVSWPRQEFRPAERE